MIGLQHILELEGVSSSQLAEKLGVSPATVSYWLTEKRLISDKMLSNIRQLFPFYPYSLFDKRIDERDKLTLENAQIKHQIETIKGDKSTASMLNRIALAHRMERNAQLMEKITIVKRVEQIFDISSEHVGDKFIMLRQNMIDRFATLCNIELLMMQCVESHDPEIEEKIHELIDALIDNLKYTMP